MSALLPLCVDLDDTLILTDSVGQQIRHVLVHAPLRAPELFMHFLKGGRPLAKDWLNRHFPVDATALPYRAELIAYLHAEKNKGRKIYLVSAAHEGTVQRVAAHIGLFDGAYGSSKSHNLKSKNKADFILQSIAADFCYAGDAIADLAVWKKAKAAILCGKAVTMRKLISPSVAIEALFPATHPH